MRGYGGIVAQKIFKFGGSETFFSVLVMRYVRKIDLEYENGKQLFQVTITKITESKENKSIHRLDVSGSTGPRGELPPPLPLAPSLATALDYILNNEQLRFYLSESKYKKGSNKRVTQ